MSKRMQYCFYCGEELGYYDNYGEPDTCGSIECLRELQNEYRAQREERMYEAEQDDYSRY